MAGEVIGFVGLGTMGAHMAANLQKAGYRLVVRSPISTSVASTLAMSAVIGFAGG